MFHIHRRANVYFSRLVPLVTSLPVMPAPPRAWPLRCIDENRISFAITSERFPKVPIRINEHTYIPAPVPFHFTIAHFRREITIIVLNELSRGVRSFFFTFIFSLICFTFYF